MDEPSNLLHRSASHQAGFTLVELMLAIVIAAVLLVIGLPSLNQMIGSQKVRSAANDLFTDLSYARSEAIKSNANVRVVRSGADWTGGWTLQDVNNNVLRAQPATQGVSASGAAVATVTFSPDGRTTSGGSLSFNFSSSNALVNMRCVYLSPSGRASVRIDRDRNGDCTDG